MPIYSDFLILDDLKTFINSKYAISTQRFITKLIERVHYGGGIDRYRIFNKLTNSYITDFDSFVNNITNIKVEYSFGFDGSIENNTAHPFTIKLSDYEVRLTNHSYEDEIYFNIYGVSEKKDIMFICGYPTDNSPTFHILDIYLVSLI